MICDLTNPEERKKLLAFTTAEALRGNKIEVKIIKEEKARTLTQNRALHLLFTQLSDQLNNSGLYMQKVLKEGVDIQWTPELIKEYLWRSVQKAQLGKESTTELTTKEIDKVFDTLVNHLGTKFGIELEFPSIETLMNKKGLR